jgi:NAD(P)-dependent dehydrogenase (short-subunit alcohol dehydrogenase family)
MQGKVIVITGAFGILGRAVARKAKQAGAVVVLIDHAPAPQDELTRSCIVLHGVDLADPPAAQRALQTIREQAGRIDALLNIAGGFAWQTLADGDIAVWERMFALNLKTAIVASKAALPSLIESSGAIVNVGANAATKAGAGMGAYAASKAGVAKLTESLAEELKGKVRVNAVLPSILDTPQNRKDMPDADPALWVAPDELAAVMLFLASDAASAVTGALVPVTGRV